MSPDEIPIEVWMTLENVVIVGLKQSILSVISVLPHKRNGDVRLDGQVVPQKDIFHYL
jgi:hypothetical protein